MVFSLKKNWVGVRVVVSYCKKIVLMLLLGCVIKSNCGCGVGCGHSSQVYCIVVVVWDRIKRVCVCTRVTMVCTYYSIFKTI